MVESSAHAFRKNDLIFQETATLVGGNYNLNMYYAGISLNGYWAE